MTIIGIAGTVICLLLYVLFASLPEGNQTEEISLRGDQKEGYTIDDMINNVKGDNSAAQRRMPMPNPEARKKMKTSNVSSSSSVRTERTLRIRLRHPLQLRSPGKRKSRNRLKRTRIQ